MRLLIPCPSCKQSHDADFSVLGRMPKDGDFGHCASCGEFFVFTGAESVTRALDADERADIDRNPMAQSILDSWAREHGVCRRLQ